MDGVKLKSQLRIRRRRLVAVLGAETEAAVLSVFMNRLVSVRGAERQAAKTTVLTSGYYGLFFCSTDVFHMVWIRMKYLKRL